MISAGDGRLGPMFVVFIAMVFIIIGIIAYQLFFGGRVLIAGQDRNRTRHWLVFVGGFLAFFVVMETTAVLIRTLGLGDLTGLPDSVAMVIVFGGPFFVSALSAYFEGGVLASFVIGTVPSIYVGVHTLVEDALGFLNPSPDSPWTFIVFILPVYTLPLAFAGFVLGAGVRFGADKLLYERR